MKKVLNDTWYMALRRIRPTFRQPMTIVMSMVQPIIWLLLFGNLFKGIVEVPGFSTDSYVEYILPGMIVMNTLFIGIYTGMGTLNDINSGVMERFLIVPINKIIIILSELVQLIILLLAQFIIIILLAIIMGAKFSLNFYSIIIFLTIPILLGLAVSALSISLALITRKHEAMITALQFFTLPLMFLSSAFMPRELMPAWIRTISIINPIDWAILGAREVLSSQIYWMDVITNGTLVLLFGVICILISLRSFKTFQRSI
ncbi:ABC transporter permease [Alkaliphilus peptidifermentans]|uniref:Transport permease protein n=1 Tax=Alkaliphilus peptidifermentans DSM 18978 TaxID=1120976 RepID=A0A1G5E5I8_9FIRM|nr:ABC transporter permease [Alkaliphilus peptidifermentans]SCY22219.1 ABC-2 type transport system permease protein [Alkaliphilus peptidifermentans DSM 18978]